MGIKGDLGLGQGRRGWQSIPWHQQRGWQEGDEPEAGPQRRGAVRVGQREGAFGEVRKLDTATCVCPEEGRAEDLRGAKTAGGEHPAGHDLSL